MSEQVTGSDPALSMIAPAGPDALGRPGWFETDEPTEKTCGEPDCGADEHWPSWGGDGAPVPPMAPCELADEPGPIPRELGAEALARDDAGRDTVGTWLEMRAASRRVIRAAWGPLAASLDRLSAEYGFPINDDETEA